MISRKNKAPKTIRVISKAMKNPFKEDAAAYNGWIFHKKTERKRVKVKVNGAEKNNDLRKSKTRINMKTIGKIEIKNMFIL